MEHTGKMALLIKWLNSVTAKDLPKSVTIVVITGLFAGGVAYSTASNVDVPLEGIGGTLQIIMAISAFVMTLLGWVFSSLICHVGARLFGGRGERNRMFALCGYTYVPTLIQQFLRFVSYWFLGQTALSANNLLEVILNYFNVFSIISLVLLGIAVTLNYGISRKKAALVALLPTIIGLSFAVYSLLILGRVARTASPFGPFRG